MVTGDLKSKVDRIWDAFWTGGMSNPVEIIEQITYLLFIRRLDELQTVEEKKASRTGKPLAKQFFTEDQEHLRWSELKHQDAQTMHRVIADEVFPVLIRRRAAPVPNSTPSPAASGTDGRVAT